MIRVLYFEGGPHHEPTSEQVRAVAARVSANIAVEDIEVTTQDQAEELKFLGSPTVQVNGLDIEPGAGDGRPVEFACRIYRTDSGMSGIPSMRWLEDALKEQGVLFDD